MLGLPLVAGFVLGRAGSFGKGTTCARVSGAAAIAAGLGCGLATIVALRRAGTSPSPYAPATALVTSGPFAFSRNPAYLGATCIYIGSALFGRSLPALALLPLALVALERGVVEREEAYLERRFGAAYRDYRTRVPRWL